MHEGQGGTLLPKAVRKKKVMFRLEDTTVDGHGQMKIIAREVEKLKRRVIWSERAGSERGRQLSFLYRSADRFGQRLYPLSYCHAETRIAIGCSTDNDNTQTATRARCSSRCWSWP